MTTTTYALEMVTECPDCRLMIAAADLKTIRDNGLCRKCLAEYQENNITSEWRDEGENEPTLLIDVFSEGGEHLFTMSVGCGELYKPKTTDWNAVEEFEQDWKSAQDRAANANPEKWNVDEVIDIMRNEFHWAIDTSNYPYPPEKE